jgi:hypothetical protein
MRSPVIALLGPGLGLVKSNETCLTSMLSWLPRIDLIHQRWLELSLLSSAMIRSRRSRLATLATLASWSRHAPFTTFRPYGQCPLLLSPIRIHRRRSGQAGMACGFLRIPPSSITSWRGTRSSQEAVGAHKQASLLSQVDSKTSSTKNSVPNTPAYTAVPDTAQCFADIAA